jgi:hypothetical protein
MANFSAPILNATVTSTYRTGGILNPVARRFQLYEAEFGQTSGAGYASTDVSCEWDLSRGITAAMAGTAILTSPLDPADTVASTTLFSNQFTTEPTYTTAGNGLQLKHWAINQRGSYRFRALDDGDNIISSATTGFLVGIRVQSGGFSGSAVGNLNFVER